jgi:enoyl-CoA hydratase/carnithine racemase
MFSQAFKQLSTTKSHIRYASTYKNIITEVRGSKKSIGLIQLNRPKALNALNAELMTELSGKFSY